VLPLGLDLTPTDITQEDGSYPNHSVKKVSKCLSSFDDWQSLRDLGHIRSVFLRLIFQSFPLNLKILRHMCPTDVCRSQPSGCIVLINHYSELLLEFGSKNEWRCCKSWSLIGQQGWDQEPALDVSGCRPTVAAILYRSLHGRSRR
jgi:hypothetical protein